MMLRAALLDMDGTLFDSHIDFLSLRESIGLPRDGRPILEQLEDATPQLRAHALSLLHAAEREGARTGTLIPGTEPLLAMLRNQDVKTALVTNNSKASLETFLERFPLRFDLVLSREDGASKPAPDLFNHALRVLEVAPKEAIAIGDTHLDCLAAVRAGVGHIVLIDLPEWMRDHLPQEAECQHVDSLASAHAMVAQLLGIPVPDSVARS